jgi:hypothetical protein
MSPLQDALRNAEHFGVGIVRWKFRSTAADALTSLRVAQQGAVPLA